MRFNSSGFSYSCGLLTLWVLLWLCSLNSVAQIESQFSSNIQSGCSPLLVQFNDLSKSTSGNIEKWHWDFGNGSQSTIQNPTATFMDPGVYTIKLSVEDGEGNSNTISKEAFISVHEDPIVDFSFSDSVGCAPLEVQFNDLSKPGGGSIEEWLWEFGDGTTSNIQNPIINFNTKGKYATSLTVINSAGCSGKIKKGVIKVAESVTAKFKQSDTSACSPPFKVTFANTSIGEGPFDFYWDFGDGVKEETNNFNSLTHEYKKPGAYTVQLKAVSPFCQNTITKENLVNIGDIKAGFEVSTNKICKGEKVKFLNNSLPTPEEVYWDFGNGITSQNMSPEIIFNESGTFIISMKAYVQDCVDSFAQQIEVLPNAISNFEGDKLFVCKPPLTVNFNNTSQSASTYEWNFGDGGNSTQFSPSHTYNKVGSFTVSLKATNNLGCTNEKIKKSYVNVNNAGLVNILVKKDKAPLTYNFTAIYNSIGADPPAKYLWEFGDGGTSGMARPSHTYAVEKKYDVRCTITTKNGCIITLVKNVDISDVGGGAGFEADPRISCSIEPIAFTDTSILADKWLWYFGDESTSTEQHPTHRYKLPGKYSVSLLIWHDGNFMDSITYPNYITIKEGPISSINFSQNCFKKDEVIFFPDSGDYVDTYLWRFGDGIESKKKDPVHIYENTGEYRVWQIVRNDNSECVDSSSVSVEVINERPNFSTEDSIWCLGDTVNLNVTGVNGKYIKSYLWNIGSEIEFSSTKQNIQFVPNKAGVYDVKLSIVDKNNCLDSIVKKNYLKIGGPKSKIFANTLFGCAPLEINLTDSSSWEENVPVLQKTWNLGNGDIHTIPLGTNNHLVKYPKGGEFNLSFELLDTFGCIWRDSLEVNVLQPIADLDVSDSINCPGRPILFRNLSQGEGLIYKWYFGDGNISIEESPSHVYEQGGRYTVSLILEDTSGCRDSLSYEGLINIYEPKANFNMSEPSAVFPPIIVNFENLSENATDYYWDFGDFSTSTEKDPEHVYNEADTFTVVLIATAHGGCSDTLSKILAIKSVEGVFNFSVDSGCAPQSIKLEAEGFNAKSIIWDFDDGNVVETTDNTVEHIYATKGVYTPKIILDKGNGKKIVVVSDHNILVDLAKADFTVDNNNFCDTALVKFTNKSDYYTDPTYYWDFGNGSQSSSEFSEILYEKSGKYPVKLKVVTASGCEDSVLKEEFIEVHILPDVLIEGDTSVCSGEIFSFNAKHNISDPTLSYVWKSDSRILSVERSFTQTLDEPTLYPVELTITNGSGCVDSATSQLMVRPNPKANIITEDTTICQNVEFILRAEGGTKYNWEPKYALSCTNCASPLAAPMKNQKYMLFVENQFGCSDQDSISIMVKEAPILKLSDDGNICEGGNYQLFSFGADSVVWSPHTWLVRPEDFNPISYPKESITYKAIGYKNKKFCNPDTGFVSVIVHPDPVINAGKDIKVFAGEPIKLKVDGDDIISWEWVGAGNFDCRQCSNPEAIFLRNTYLKVFGTNEYGCVGEDDLEVNVLCGREGLYVPNAFSPNGDGLNDRFFISGIGVEKVVDFKIYNRWGQLVFENSNFELNSFNDGWDGIFNGSVVKPQTLVYFAKVKCNFGTFFTVKGFVTVTE